MTEQALAHSVARFKGLWFCSLLAIAACNTPAAEQKPEPVAANTTAQPAAGYKLYGTALNPELKPVSLSDVLSKPGDFEGKTVHVDAKVRRACSQKGCWMELAEGSEDKPATCRVTFKDYGFFVPTDSAGAEARLEGVVKLKKVTADHVQHMEQEGATFAQKHPDGSASEVALVATGVELKK